MADGITPLFSNQQIVTEDGYPNQFFIRWAQERSQEINNGVPPSRKINTGTGLQGGGDLSADRTISLNASLGNLNDVNLSTPPTDQQVIVFDAATNKWIPADQSGGSTGGHGFKVDAVGTGASQVIILPSALFAIVDVLVFVNGIRYECSEYTIVGANLTITTNAAGDSIEIVGPLGAGGTAGKPWYWAPPLTTDFPVTVGAVALTTYTDDADVGLMIASPASHTGALGKVKSVTAGTSFTATMHINTMVQQIGTANSAIIIGNGTQYLWCGYDTRGSLHTMKYSTTGYDGYEKLVSMWQWANWYRTSYDAATDIFTAFYSPDGKQWILYDTITSVTSYITGGVAQLGIGFTTESYANILAISVDHWDDTL